MITIYNDIGNHYMHGTREKTLQVWKRNNLDYLDITDYMIDKSYNPEELFIYGIWGNHYTKLGYKIASDAIYYNNIEKKFSD
mgnify:CR=1 FL=1